MKNTAVRLLLVLSCFLLKSFPLFSQNLIIPSQYYKVTENTMGYHLLQRRTTD